MNFYTRAVLYSYQASIIGSVSYSFALFYSYDYNNMSSIEKMFLFEKIGCTL